MPMFSTIFFLLTLANSGFPLFCNFIGELTCIASAYKYDTFTALLGSTGMIFGAIYSFWLFNRICFRKFNANNLTNFNKISDININEFSVLILFTIIAFFLGVYPSIVLNNIYSFML
jgi:NADH-quinone oxidoreductase subunit M